MGIWTFHFLILGFLLKVFFSMYIASFSSGLAKSDLRGSQDMQAI